MGTFTSTSDVDIALYGDNLTMGDQAELQEKIEQLPMPQKVDLLRHMTIKNKELLKHIEKHGVVWVGRDAKAMSEWNIAQLGDVAKVQSGFAFKSSDMGTVGAPIVKIKNIKPPLVTVSNVQRVPHAVITNNPRTSQFGLDSGDILIAMTGATVGKVGRMPNTTERYYLNQRVGKVFLSEPDVADYDYLYYVLSQDTHVRQMFGIADGSAQANISPSQIEGLKIPLPPLPEQKAIAHILGTLDDKIELNRRMNETLEGIVRAIFKSWFVDFDPVRAKVEGRETGLPKDIEDLFPDSFEESKLGKIPKGWKVEAIGTAARCVGGSTPRTKELKYWEGGTIPFVTPRDMSSLSSPVVLDAERHITEDGVNTISSRMLPPHAVLLSSRAPVGYLAITQTPVCVNQGIIAMICEGPISAEYILRWCETRMDAIKGNASGTTFAEISKRNFRPLSIIIPDDVCASHFTAIASHLRKMVVKNLLENANLILVRDRLLPVLLSGAITSGEVII